MVAPFSFSEYFFLAEWLLDTSPKTPHQSVLRTIISRAYYSALISAREFTGVDSKAKDGHRLVIEALRKTGQAEAANKPASLKLRRNNADYNLASSFTSRDASICLLDSREVLYAAKTSIPRAKTYSQDYLDSSKFCTPQKETQPE